MAWEIDWGYEGNTGSEVLGRSVDAHIKKARAWHMVTTGYLRKYTDIVTPTYRSDSWEIDWSKRDIQKKLVMARNPYSKMPLARSWHWICQSDVMKAGMKWKPYKENFGRSITSLGYVNLTRRAMTDEDIKIADEYKLWAGKDKNVVKEHRLVAAKKYKCDLSGMVVRHLNGNKEDNSPDNLVVGTIAENNMDHQKARMMAMYWHRKYLDLLETIGEQSV